MTKVRALTPLAGAAGLSRWCVLEAAKGCAAGRSSPRKLLSWSTPTSATSALMPARCSAERRKATVSHTAASSTASLSTSERRGSRRGRPWGSTRGAMSVVSSQPGSQPGSQPARVSAHRQPGPWAWRRGAGRGGAGAGGVSTASVTSSS